MTTFAEILQKQSAEHLTTILNQKIEPNGPIGIPPKMPFALNSITILPQPIPEPILSFETPLESSPSEDSPEYSRYKQQCQALCTHFQCDMADLALIAINSFYNFVFETN